MYDTDKTTGCGPTSGGLPGCATIGFCQTVRMHNFCPECGRKREAFWNFCPYDGTNLAAQPPMWLTSYPNNGGLIGQAAQITELQRLSVSNQNLQNAPDGVYTIGKNLQPVETQAQ